MNCPKHSDVEMTYSVHSGKNTYCWKCVKEVNDKWQKENPDNKDFRDKPNKFKE